MKTKKTKLDLIWIIPEIIGCLAIGVSAALHIGRISLYKIGLMEWTFQIGLVLVVVMFTFKVLGHACEELKEVIGSKRWENEWYNQIF